MIKILVLLVTFTLFLTAKSEKCRALAMSGGGDKGAYQAAVFMGLIEYLNPEDVQYDVITGVSAGSLNALGLALFDKSELKEASEFVSNLWKSSSSNKLFDFWGGGLFAGLFTEKGLFDVSPGKQWITEQIANRTLKRKVSFATTDADSAEYFVIDYNATDILPDDTIESAFASAALPGIFSQVIRGDRTLIDGGVIWNLDLHSAIRRCKEIVTDEKDIIVDMILCGNPNIELDRDIKDLSAMDHFFRSKQIKDFYSSMSDYQSSMEFYPDVEFRYLLAPSEKVIENSLPLTFSDEQIESSFMLGKKDAQQAVLMGPNANKLIVLSQGNNNRR